MWEGHLGDTPVFQFYDLFADGRIVPVGDRVNTARDAGHGKKEKMAAVLALVEEAQVLVAARMSPNFERIARTTRVQPVVVSSPDLTYALQRLCGAYPALSAAVLARLRGDEPGPVFTL